VFNFGVIFTEQVGEVVTHCTYTREVFSSNHRGTSAILTEVSLGFPQSLKANIEIRPRQFPFPFITHQSSYNI
jgi:hypothetical protein